MTEHRARSIALRGVAVCPALGSMAVCSALLLVGASALAAGQNPSLPSPAQAQQLLQQAQQNPKLADQLRQRLQQTRLTPEQIRARLQASGYHTNLVDAYLRPAAGGPTTAPTATAPS